MSLCSIAGLPGSFCSPAIRRIVLNPSTPGSTSEIVWSQWHFHAEGKASRRGGCRCWVAAQRALRAARPPQGVEPARRSRLQAAARQSHGRWSAFAGASSPDPPSQRRAGWKGSGDVRARGMLWPCGFRRPREAYRHWRWRTEAVTPVLQAVTESRVGPHRSTLPPAAAEKDPGALEAGVARGPAADAGCLQCLCSWNLRHPRGWPDWHWRRPAGRVREEILGWPRVGEWWRLSWGIGSTDGWGSLGVSFLADLTGECTRVPSPSFPRKPSGFGCEGSGVPSSFWPVGSLAAPCRSAGPAPGSTSR